MRLAAIEYPSVKIGPYFFNRPLVGRVTYPDHLVIAGVIVFRKVDVIFPEEVIGDEAGIGMEDCREVLERKELCWRREDAGREAAHSIPFLWSQRTGRIEFERAVVGSARIIKASAQVMFDTTFVI